MHRQYLWYVLRHKWFVFIAGLKLGVPLWSLLIHDWDKFLPSMWTAYAIYFYGPRAKSRTQTYAEKDQFDLAWLGHQNRNKHHWQWWTLLEDSGFVRAMELPVVHRREMLADWMGAGMARGKPDTAAWYRKNSGNMRINGATRDWLEKQLGIQR